MKVVALMMIPLAWLAMTLGFDRPPSASAPAARFASSAIAVNGDGSLVVAVNPDSGSISLVDTATLKKTAEIRVGPDPRAVALDGERNLAYVVLRGADELVGVDLVTREIASRVGVGYRPAGVAVGPGAKLIAVAETGDDSVRVLDAATLATLATVAVAGRPTGLAFTPDGRRLLVTQLLGGEVAMLALDDLAAAPGRIATWPNVAPAPAVIINDAGTRAYLPQTMANGQGLNTQFDNSVFPKISVLNLESNTHQSSEHISLPEKDQPVGLPWDAALLKGGGELWVVNAGSNDISVLDVSAPTRVRRAAHIPVGDHPRGLAVSPDGARVWVNNTLAGTVSVINASSYAVEGSVEVTTIPLPPALLNGKRLFHSSARGDLAQAAWMSCNTCHIEGEHDGRTWVLNYAGAVPEGQKPVIRRNTTSLLGMIETYPLRWSGEWDESADSEFSIRFEQYGTGLIKKGGMHPTLGPLNQGRSYDLDCLAAYIDSLPSPARRRGLSEAAVRGRALFESAATRCAECHPAPLYTDLKMHDVGTADGPGEWFGPRIDNPTLRFLMTSAPYLHDGSAATLRDVLTTANQNDRHGVTSHLTAAEIDDLVEFLKSLPYEP